MSTGYRPEIIQHAFVDFIGSRIQPFWSLNVPKLRLLTRYTLSDDLIALQFETSRAFRRQGSGVQNDWQGGQHLNVSVLIDELYYQRSYSLIGLPQQPLRGLAHDNFNDAHDPCADNHGTHNHSTGKNQRHTVTVAIKPQGTVSDYLTKRMPLGTIINSSIPTGDFTLEKLALAKQTSSPAIGKTVKSSALNPSAPLLFIAGGSGITPMLGLITQALQYGHAVTLLHYNRTVVLKSQWQRLAVAHPNFTYHLINTEDSATYLAGIRHLTKASLLALDMPLAETKIFACGSQRLLTSLYSAAAEIALPQGENLCDNIMVESFGQAMPEFNNNQSGNHATPLEKKTIHLRARQQQFDSDTTLLTAAEAAGIRLTHGCRQGICQLCRCNKISGVVKNIQTGKISSDGCESIQTCINIAMTDVVLDI